VKTVLQREHCSQAWRDLRNRVTSHSMLEVFSGTYLLYTFRVFEQPDPKIGFQRGGEEVPESMLFDLGPLDPLLGPRVSPRKVPRCSGYLFF